MNPFEVLETDTITVLKSGNEKIENIKASVQEGQIFISRSDILIEPKNVVVRRMSNGGEETYLVIDPGFHEKFHAIPAGYQMKVKKILDPREAEDVKNNL